MRCEKEKATSHNLDGIADKHYPPLWHGVSESTDKRGKNYIEKHKYKLKHGGEIGGGVQIDQQGDRNNQ